MQFMSSWGTEDRKTLLHLSESALDAFAKHIQVNDTDTEAGGLLLGSVHGTNILIEQATIPTKWDKRLRYLFERLPYGHEAIALTQWTESRGTIRYLGEWHTHPENDPSPSGIDRYEWNILASKRLDKRPLLAMIVGRKSLYVELVPSMGVGQVLLAIE